MQVFDFLDNDPLAKTVKSLDYDNYLNQENYIHTNPAADSLNYPNLVSYDNTSKDVTVEPTKFNSISSVVKHNVSAIETIQSQPKNIQQSIHSSVNLVIQRSRAFEASKNVSSKASDNENHDDIGLRKKSSKLDYFLPKSNNKEIIESDDDEDEDSHWQKFRCSSKLNSGNIP